MSAKTLSPERRYKYFFHLAMWNVILIIICIPTAGKIVNFFGFPTTVSILYFPFIYIFSDVLTEVYGYAAARRVIWYNTIAQLFTMVVFQFVAYYPPASSFHDDASYRTVLTTAPWLVCFGILAVFTGDVANNYVLAKMKVATGKTQQALRFVLSTIAGQGVNTAVYWTFGLWGLIPLRALLPSIAIGTVFKVAVEIVMLPVTLRFANFLKKAEREDYLDVGTDFNPFKF